MQTRIAKLLCLCVLLFPLLLRAQDFVYVNNQSGTSNTISSFSVDTGGVLTSLGSVSTGGIGAIVACAGIDRVTVNGASNLLFVSNSGEQSISVFRITPATGALTAVTGSPFATGLTLDSCAGISLASTPDGKFLMASSNGVIKTFSVGVNGALSVSATASLLPSPMVGMKISGDGRFLAVSHQASVSVLTISGVDGSLTAVTGSPFAKTGTGLVGGVEFNCDGTLLYAAEGGAASSITDAWSVAATGALTPIVGSPFIAAGTDSNVLFLSPDNTALFQSNQGSNDMNYFTVNPDGTLTSVGAFNDALGRTPVGIGSDNSGLFLFSANDGFGMDVFNIVPGAVATLVSNTVGGITGAGHVQGLAAYPPRSCAHSDFSITQTASPNPVTAGSQITYNITLTNNGPSAASVAINDLLPRTFVTFVSCTPGAGGVCDKGAGLNRTITFASLASGQSGSATIVATAVSTLLNGDTITNTANVSNASSVDPNPANNSATTNVTVSAPLAASKLTVANATGSYFGTANLSATLTRVLNGAVVAGRTVTFSLNGTVMGTGVTNASGIATLSNVSLAGINAGTYPVGVSVNFAGDSQFSGTSGSAIFTVNKLPLTVTTQNASRFFGDPNPTFTYVITGFVNNETTAVVSGSANCNTSASATSPPNGYTIACSIGTLSATNYSFVFVNAVLTVNPAPLVLAANNVSRLYGDPNPALTGTVTGLKNGNQATATFSTAAVATSPVGSYPILGTVIPGSGFVATNYSISSTGAVTVTPAPLTATANNATRVYGDANPAFTGTLTGVKNGDAVTATFASTADPTSAVGAYPITATLSGAPQVISNYSVTTNGGTLTITPAALSVAAANSSRLYGDANPAFSGTINGIKNADNITATYASTAVAGSAVGAYPITPTLVDPTSKLGNYTVTSTNGTLTVSAAPLSVAAANASRLYGDPNPVFAGTITGIKNGDNITATYASVADPTSAVGTFAIVPTLVDPTGKLGNYSVVSGNGVLTINPAPLSVAGANASRLYGDPNPAFTGTITGLKNGDNITAGFASVAGPASAVGTYAIVPTLADPTAKLGNYAVIATNGTLTIGPAPLTVAGTNASRAYGDPNPAFTGTISGIKNGDNITATFDSAATVTSSVGTYPIVAALVDPTAKLGNYTVVSNNGTLTVSPTALTVSAAGASRIYGDPNPSFTGTITGLKNGDAITASFSTTATAASPVGSYAITPSLADPTAKLGNYTVNSVNGSLTVTVAALTVNAGSASRAYGDPNPPFSGTIAGLKNGDAITATYLTVADATSPIGTYPVTPTLVDPGLKLGNYAVTSTNGTLTVTPAALTVTAANASRLYGDPNPVFTGAIAGLKNGDAISATFASPATAASPVGSYSIIPTLVDPTAKLANYTTNVINGSLTVSPAPLNVSAASVSRVYGDANPAFTGTITGLKNADAVTATYASAATAASAVGAYAIVPTLADPTGVLGNYSVSISNGTLTVTAAPLTVSANNATRAYGDPNPAFSGTITGLKNGDNVTASFTSADAASPVGAYPIVPALADPTAKLGNYSLTSSNGVLTVTAAALTVNAGNATRVYGDPNPAFAGTITGLKNGDAITATYASVADPTSPVGTYPVQASLVDPTGKLGNYTVTSNAGTLTVTPALLTATASNASRIYGDPNPAFTGTIAGIKNGDAITASFATAATGASAVGAYPIVPSLADPTLKLGNYSVTLVNGSLAVSPAALSVTANNAKRNFGAANPAFTGTITGLKNADNITATFSTAATSASPAGTYSIVPALQDPTAKLGNYTVTSNNGTLTVIGIPAAVSVTPSTGTATSAVFSAVYSDASGGGLITDAYMLINSVLKSAGSCEVHYVASKNQLFLINDAGGAGLGPLTPGVAGTVQNSQCVLDGATSSAVTSANNLTVNASVSFLPAFIGNKNVYLIAVDAPDNATSAVAQLGSWSLPVPKPVAVSVTPSAGTASSAVFSATYSDAAGGVKITDAYVLINSVLRSAGACEVHYVASKNQLFLINDAGGAGLGPLTPGVAGTVQNSQCVLDGATSSAVTSANNLTVNASVSFLPAFIGNKNVYLIAVDAPDNATSAVAQLGTWSLPVPTPVAVSVTPSAGTASSAVFSATYSDAAGAGRISDAYLLINNVLASAKSCEVHYVASKNQLFLINDAGGAGLGPLTPGVAGTVQNSQCVLDGATSSAVTSANNLTVNASVSFLPAFIGNKNVYLIAVDAPDNATSAVAQLGTWSLPVPTPVAVSVTPSAGTASSAVFSATYSDAAGAGRISDAYLLINNVLASAKSCEVHYVASKNQLFLINDAGGAGLGPLTPGVAGTVQNSQCVLDGATSSAVTSGNNLTVNASVSFLPAFAGSKNIYLVAIDAANNATSAVAQLGSWNVP